MTEKQIRLLVVDDHPVVREGLVAMIAMQNDMTVVAEAANGNQAVEQFHKHHPDVTLMDLRLPEKTGLEAIQEIRSDFPNARVVVLTIAEGDEDIHRALEAGAQAYLLKDADREEMLNTIRKVHEGRRHIPPNVASKLAEHIPRVDLSARELEVLERMVIGESNKEIAGALSISELTVKVHVSNILAKLHANDRTEAVSIAIRRGIVHL